MLTIILVHILHIMIVAAKYAVKDKPPVNDPLYGKQKIYLEAIGVPEAWRRLTSTRVRRSKVTVASIDTGVMPNHPDLVENLVPGYNVIRHNSDTEDEVGHGTRMAGIFGATINNSYLMAGVADMVNILPVSFEDQYTDQAEADAIDWVIRNKQARGIKVILMPVSSYEKRPMVTAKLNQADQAGLLVIVTAGNNGDDITTHKRFPCALTEELSGMLCVSATEQLKMRLAHFSSFGNYVDIAAPGVGIVATSNFLPYDIDDGTSASAAIIAGVASMLYSIAPDLTPGDVKMIIKTTARMGLKDATGKVALPFGRVDADKAVASLIPQSY